MVVLVDSGASDLGFEPHDRRVVSLSKTVVLHCMIKLIRKCVSIVFVFVQAY